MKCDDMKGLLSAYANDEVSDTERERVEQHLAGCADCRATLESYRAIRQQLGFFGATPVGADIRESTMARVRAKAARKNVGRRWLRPALAAVPVAVAVAAVLFAWQPWHSGAGTDGLASRVRAATVSLQSYRVDSTQEIVQGGTTQSIQYQVAFSGPDSYQTKAIGDSVSGETIRIGSRVYQSGQQPPTPQLKMSGTIGLSMWSSTAPSKEETLDLIDSLKSIQQLPDETIDGVDCLHYRGQVAMDQIIPDSQTGPTPDDPVFAQMWKEQSQQAKAWMQSWTRDVDIWIGKQDHLPRQEVDTIHVPPFTPADAAATMTTTERYYAFDTPVQIQAPLDANGGLLPGWSLSIDYNWLSQFALSGEQHIGIDTKDPAHQKVDFSLDVTNHSAGPIANVRVIVSSITASGQNVLQTMEAVPSSGGEVDLAPGESENFSLTWDYAGPYSKDDLTRIVSVTEVEAKYVTSDGKEFTQPFPRQGLPVPPLSTTTSGPPGQ